MEETDSYNLTDILKTMEIKDNATGILLKPFNGSESTQYEVWLDRRRSPEIMQYLHPNTPFTSNPNETATAKEFVDYLVKDPHVVYYRIEHPVQGFVGHIGLSSIKYDEMSCALSFVLGERSTWGKGIATNAVKTLLPHLKELGFKKLTANARVENTRSRSVLQKFFQETGIENNSVSYELDLTTGG